MWSGKLCAKAELACDPEKGPGSELDPAGFPEEEAGPKREGWIFLLMGGDWRFRQGWKSSFPSVPLSLASLSPVLVLSRRVLGALRRVTAPPGPRGPARAWGARPAGDPFCSQGSPQPFQGVWRRSGGPARRAPPAPPPRTVGPGRGKTAC